MKAFETIRDAGARKSLGGFFVSLKLSALPVMIGLGVVAGLFGAVGAGKPVTRRPPIVGIAHIGLKTDNLAGAREFYGHTLGFQEPFTVDKPTGGLMLTYFKVNDHQYIELFPNLASPTKTGFRTLLSRPRMPKHCAATLPNVA